ncbi:hypothetical protein RRG08_022866 [Elysia crispata]|uniref:Polycystin domain-containing protein n=1 Tax=Elysia crispata TaxID=231223 RepID=A0AAE0Z0H2_9GAST|nr:hypothetical protein RRG08_022866 [Elysia crispata]
MLTLRGMDKFIIEFLENAQCLNSDPEPDDGEKNKGHGMYGKATRKKNLKSMAWEVVFYSVFMTLLICIAFDNRDDRSYGFHSSILAAADPKGNISRMSTPAEMFGWARDHLTPFLYGTMSWDNSTLLDTRRVTASLASYRLGPTRIRQHRTSPEPCKSPNQLRPFNVRCVPSWSSSDHDWADYLPEWTLEDEDNSLSDGSRSPWQYSRWADIGGTPVAGRLGVYPNGGYVQDMTGTLDEVNACLTQLQRLHWIDEWTKVVFIETTIYTPNINMFAMITAIFEFPQAMVIHAQLYTHPFK